MLSGDEFDHFEHASKLKLHLHRDMPLRGGSTPPSTISAGAQSADLWRHE
jgi:hypothetical protein